MGQWMSSSRHSTRHQDAAHAIADATVAEVMRGARSGDRGAVTLFVKLFQGRVFRIVRGLVPASHIEDVAQETFLTLFKKLPRYREQGKLEHWVSTWAVRTSYDYLRVLRRRERVEHQGGEELEEEGIQLSDSGPHPDRHIIEAALSRLSAQDRIAIVLVLFHGFSYRDAAALIGWSLVGTKVRVFRARRRLQLILRERANE